jgi:hypothetical protein
MSLKIMNMAHNTCELFKYQAVYLKHVIMFLHFFSSFCFPNQTSCLIVQVTMKNTGTKKTNASEYVEKGEWILICS